MARRQIERARDGSYRLRLSRPERELLAALPAELELLLESPPSPDLRRLFPPAYEKPGTRTSTYASSAGSCSTAADARSPRFARRPGRTA
jgi:hypothetical protein